MDFSEVLEEIMARRQRKDIKSEINIVPFLDVLLVLVLIFMATAPIISQSVQVELPDSVQSQNVSNEDKTPVILEVAGIGQYSISIGGQRQEGLNEEMVTQLSKQEFDKDNNTKYITEIIAEKISFVTTDSKKDESTGEEQFENIIECG